MSTKKKPTRNKKSIVFGRVLALGVIDTDSANDIIETIYDINLEDEELPVEKREMITLIVNSPGGEVYDGLAIADIINLSDTPVKVVVMGKAMSMGLLVAACGHYRVASKNARFMYHEGYYEAGGTGKIHINELAEYKKTENAYDVMLLEKTKITPKMLKSVRAKSKEWYFGAEEALKLGVIDAILE